MTRAPVSAIRVAGVAHAAALAAIHAAAFAPDFAWSAPAIAVLLAQPGVFGLVHAGGGMAMGRVAADEAELLTLAVAPGCQRRGLGSALLRAACSQAAEMGAASVFLEVSAANAAALALYAGAGFVPVGKRRRYYPDGADALVLRAPLIRPGAAAAG